VNPTLHNGVCDGEIVPVDAMGEPASKGRCALVALRTKNFTLRALEL
jgi:hypothetical protein